MSTICLAAQRSYTTGEQVWFSYRLPGWRKMLGTALLWILGLSAMIIAGLYAHTVWNLHHPAPTAKKVSVAKPEAQLSDMHYVFVSKPFPHPKPPVIQAAVHANIPPMQDMPIQSDDADWQNAPEGDIPRDTSRDTLPGTEKVTEHPTDAAENNAPDNDVSLQEMLMQAVKEQEKDYAQGKIPAPPVEDTQRTDKEEMHEQTRASPFSEKGDGKG